jgi:CBS domain-containing protein
MSSHVAHVSPDDTIEHYMALVTENYVRHLLVMKNDRAIDMISIGDLSKMQSTAAKAS